MRQAEVKAWRQQEAAWQNGAAREVAGGASRQVCGAGGGEAAARQRVVVWQVRCSVRRWCSVVWWHAGAAAGATGAAVWCGRGGGARRGSGARGESARQWQREVVWQNATRNGTAGRHSAECGPSVQIQHGSGQHEKPEPR